MKDMYVNKLYQKIIVTSDYLPTRRLRNIFQSGKICYFGDLISVESIVESHTHTHKHTHTHIYIYIYVCVCVCVCVCERVDWKFKRLKSAFGDVITAVDNFLTHGNQALLQRRKTCTDSQGNYVEK